MGAADQVRELTTAFLDMHGERIVENLSERLREAGDALDLLPIHCALFDLARARIRDRRSVVEGIPQALAGVDPSQGPLLSGQIALWNTLHRMVWEVEGPHRNFEGIHAVLALVGDTLDGLIGALIDLARSGQVASPGWETLVELGRTHREFQALNRLTHDLVSARDPGRMFDLLEEDILGTFHLRGLVIATVDHEEGYVEVVRSRQALNLTRNPTGWRYDLSHPDILCEVARMGRSEVIDGWDPRYHTRIVREDGGVAFVPSPPGLHLGRTAFFIPILAGDRAIGVVATGSHRVGKEIVLREIERMRPFLHQVGATLSAVSEIIGRRRAEEELRKAHDALEQRVAARTAELSMANTLLQAQIVERRRAEAAQAQLTDEVELQRKRLDDLLADVPGVVWEAWGEPDAATQRIDFVSDYVVAMLGYSVEEWLKTPNFWIAIVHPDDKEGAARTAAALFADRKRGTNQFRWVARDGRTVWVEAHSTVICDETGAPVGMRGVTMDISERRRAEEALREAERLRVLAQAAVGAAHEIFQPLTAIIGQAELVLSRMASDDPRRKDLEIIRRAGYQVSDIVTKMQAPKRYATKSYIEGVDMIDFDAAAQEGQEGQ